MRMELAIGDPKETSVGKLVKGSNTPYYDHISTVGELFPEGGTVGDEAKTAETVRAAAKAWRKAREQTRAGQLNGGGTMGVAVLADEIQREIEIHREIAISPARGAREARHLSPHVVRQLEDLLSQGMHEGMIDDADDSINHPTSCNPIITQSPPLSPPSLLPPPHLTLTFRQCACGGGTRRPTSRARCKRWAGRTQGGSC